MFQTSTTYSSVYTTIYFFFCINCLMQSDCCRYLTAMFSFSFISSLFYYSPFSGGVCDQSLWDCPEGAAAAHYQQSKACFKLWACFFIYFFILPDISHFDDLDFLQSSGFQISEEVSTCYPHRTPSLMEITESLLVHQESSARVQSTEQFSQGALLENHLPVQSPPSSSF